MSWLNRPWLERWLMITSEGVGYITKNDLKHNAFREYNFYPKNFQIFLKYDNVLTLKLDIRSFEIKIKVTLILVDLLYTLIEGYDQSAATQINPYNSFCKRFENNSVRFYINGFPPYNYFHDLYEALMKAEKEVFINDWFFSPEIYLLRPREDYPHTRLDLVLTEICKKGVTVYIILYREMEEALYNNSARVKDYMSKLHPNIHIVRHPRYFIHLWSHHEKMVVIDSKYVFMGGIDLCFGRYEYPRYPLCEPIESKTVFHGQDYSNPRIRDFEEVTNWEKCLVDKSAQPRMPWRDIAIRLQGPIVGGMKRHFLQFWNFNNIQFSYKNSNLKIQDKHGIDEQTFNMIINEDQKSVIKPVEIIKAFEIKSRRSFIENEKLNSKKDLKSQLIPDEEDQDIKINTNDFDSQHKLKIKRAFENEVITSYFDFEDNEDDGLDPEDNRRRKIGLNPTTTLQTDQHAGNYFCQGLRSGSLWSIGLPISSHEQSIQNAYIKLIENSEYFVYIENQFFISSCAGDVVTNKVVETLANRIIRAIEEQKPYVAYIVLPLLPGFGGNIVEKDGQLLRIQIEWHLATIYKSETSLIKRVMAYDTNWEKYIKIFGLRNHALMNGKPVSEIVYVHSKLIIVDDKVCLIGSANINDRSLRGDRDSELACVIEEMTKEPFKLGGKLVNKSPGVRNFRINCWKSLFEVDADYEDPLDPVFQEKIELQAEINENFYFKLFGFYPHNSLKTLNDIALNQREIALEYYMANKHLVKGFALRWPTYFLENEKQLRTKFLDVGTALLPEIVFT